MASFRQRGTRWNVQVIRKNNPRISKTFSTKEAAKCWARKTEREIDLKHLKIINYPTFSAIIERYIKNLSSFEEDLTEDMKLGQQLKEHQKDMKLGQQLKEHWEDFFFFFANFAS